MKKSAFVLSALLLAGGAIHAQQVKVDTFDSLVVRYATPEVSVATVPFADGKAEVLETREVPEEYKDTVCQPEMGPLPHCIL